MFEKRAQFQLSTVHNLIAQESNIQNIDVAKDSKAIAEAAKRDSASMKTIAVLGTVFLPGAFVSALFAIPLFDWDAPRVVKPRFWIFWAVTVPLTAVVILGYWVWTKWSGRKEDARVREEEREKEYWRA